MKPLALTLIILCAGCTTQRPTPVVNVPRMVAPLPKATVASAAAVAPQPRQTITIAWQAGYEPHGNAYVQLGWTGLDRTDDLVHWTPESRFEVTQFRQWFTNTVPAAGPFGAFRVIEGYRRSEM